MKFHYNYQYDPPAPFVELTLINSNEMLRTNLLSAMVDTGADNTIVPISYLEDIGVPQTMERFIRTQWGDRHPVGLYLVDVKIGDLTLPSIDVVGDEWADELIVGRDILNRLRLLSDGPQKIITITE